MFTSEAIASFNKLELSVYQYVSKNKQKVMYMRIRELAEETNVSTATILRFCRKLGCDGFSEFKARLKLYAKQSHDTAIQNIDESAVRFFDRVQNEALGY